MATLTRRCERRALVLLVLFLQVATAPASSAKSARSAGVIVLSSPLWITAVKRVDRPYSWSFPEPATSEHFTVVNAGYWLWSKENSTQVTYEFSLNVTNPFPERVFTRATLENPESAEKAIVYEHYLDPDNRTTKVTHGPLRSLKMNQEYTLTFEAFSEPSRTILLDRVTQQIVSLVDNADGCVDLAKEAKQEHFAGIPAPGKKKEDVAVKKLRFVCEKLDRGRP